MSAAGLVPALALAVKTGLSELADTWLTLPEYFGANAGLKVTALVAGMLAGADSIDDMAVLRHGVATVAPIVTGIDDYALVDVDDTIQEVHGYQKQGSGYGYSGVRGLNALNALIGVVSTLIAAPIILGSRLRKGPWGVHAGPGSSSATSSPK